MLNPTVQDALNAQIRDEFYASYLYLAMAAYYESAGLPGFAHWMRAQSEEERAHALKIYDFVHQRGGRVVLQAIEQPPAEFDSPLAAFEAALAHEQGVTQGIHSLYELAASQSDYATQVMLQWFISEQVEEERSTAQVVERLRLAAEHPPLLFILDRQLGAREG